MEEEEEVVDTEGGGCGRGGRDEADGDGSTSISTRWSRTISSMRSMYSS